MSNAIDLTGQRFGRLTVIERYGTGQGKSKYATWLCKCDCGNLAVRTSKNLKIHYNSGCDSCRRTREDLTGKRFGMLTVISKSCNRNKNVYWNCRCDCGNTIEVKTAELNRGTTISCGCYAKKRLAEENTKHDKSDTRLYKIWYGMKRRCYDSEMESYEDYGGRGITICKEWLDDFMNFYNWAMANGYRDDLTIERKDVNGNYCPENCCWATYLTQARNHRNTIRLELFGYEKPLAEWNDIAEVSYYRSYQRYKRGAKIFDEKELEKIKKYLENGGN